MAILLATKLKKLKSQKENKNIFSQIFSFDNFSSMTGVFTPFKGDINQKNNSPGWPYKGIYPLLLIPEITDERSSDRVCIFFLIRLDTSFRLPHKTLDECYHFWILVKNIWVEKRQHPLCFKDFSFFKVYSMKTGSI